MKALIKKRLVYILFTLTFLTSCSSRSGGAKRTFGRVFGFIEDFLQIPAVQKIVVFVITWIIFYAIISYGLRKSGMFSEGNEGTLIAVAGAVLFTLPVIWATRGRDLTEIFKGNVGFVAGLLLGVFIFMFVYQFVDRYMEGS